MIIERKVFGFIALALTLALAAPQSALAQGQDGDADASKPADPDDPLYNCRKAKGKVSVSFKPEVELKDLISWAMGFTCKNFVYGSGIGGRSAKVTIIAPQKMSAYEAWRVFLVALQTMGLTVVPKGNVLKIVEAAQSKKDSIPIYRTGSPSSDEVVRMLIRPEHVSVDDLGTALNAVTSKDGMVTALPKAGAVLVTDYGSHIARMKTLLRELDRPVVGESLYMIKVQHADVTELAQKLTEILGSRDAGAPAPAPARGRGRAATPQQAPAATLDQVEAAVPSKILADERINALIVLATEPAYLRVRALVKRLDIPVEVEGGGRIHVHYLDNADAEQLSTTLTSVLSGIQQPASARAQTRGRQPAPAAAPAGAGTPAFEGQVRVTHDAPTNSLVVVASVKDFLALRDGVIKKLDAPRRQVFIEAVILEVSVNDSRNLGVSFHGGKDLSNGSILLGGLQHSELQSLNVASLATSTGLIGGAVGPLLDNAQELLGTSIPSFGLLFQALASNSNVNVLSSPHILTTDNEEAEISVGQNIPYQASVSGFGNQPGGGATTPGFGFPLQSIQRQDVALTLKITPHINATDMVRLEIDQEISDIADPNFGGNGPSWSKRTVKTTVVVKDQQSVVIGGLMSDRTTSSESKIPLLGDIPLFGYLFKYSTKTKAKTNLLILLTPYVIKDQLDIEEIVQRKVRERREFMRTFTNFTNVGYRSDIDYARKRGLVEEINHVVAMIEEEAALLRDLDRNKETFPDGAIDYEATERYEGDALRPVRPAQGQDARDDDDDAPQNQPADAEGDN
ncbi:MAG TPA: type II secretion system secretin GspD [Kofleriaceae bacterium]|nr:type II secretion system secretin GspD [Kofleriaceae bacterium]